MKSIAVRNIWIRVCGYSSSVGVLHPDWLSGSLESTSGGTGEDGGLEGGDGGWGGDAAERKGECRDRGEDGWGDRRDDGRP